MKEVHKRELAITFWDNNKIKGNMADRERKKTSFQGMNVTTEDFNISQVVIT